MQITPAPGAAISLEQWGAEKKLPDSITMSPRKACPAVYDSYYE